MVEPEPSFHQRQETYAPSAQPSAPKAVFTLLGDLIDGAPELPRTTCLDVGCATGDLTAYLCKRFSTLHATGIDVVPEFIHRAQLRDDARMDFELADILTFRDGQFDLVTCFGMLGIFDDFEPLLQKLIALTAPGGRVFIHALLNPDDIDVRIRYRDNLQGGDAVWHRGFNIFSQSAIDRWLAERCTRRLFHKVVMPLDIPKRPATPHRAYTIGLGDGTRATTNGLCLLLPEYLLEIRL